MAANRPGKLPADEFHDPLSNYEPPTYADPLEEALDRETVAALQLQPCGIVSPEVTIREALAKLVDMHHACLLVEEGGHLVGVFTDRDVLDRVALELDEVSAQPLRTVMTPNPIYVYETDSAAAALTVMAVSGFRHVPVLRLDGSISGVVTPRRVTEFLMAHTSR
jgi:signal-transduction protein with cAMP-binding, CBS, and nucleotidyltransferase domain